MFLSTPFELSFSSEVARILSLHKPRVIKYARGVLLKLLVAIFFRIGSEEEQICLQNTLLLFFNSLKAGPTPKDSLKKGDFKN